MKKLLALLIMAASFAACEGPMGPMGPDGPSGKVQKKTVWITVKSQHWVRVPETGPFSYFECLIDMPELTPQVIDEGFFYTYFCWYDSQILVQEGTGVTIYNEYSDGTLWEQTIACDYSDYQMKFYIRNSDFNDRRPQDDMEFRFVAIW